MLQLANQLQFLNAWNKQQVRELQMSIDHFLEQHSTQFQQQLQQLLAFSSLTFQLETSLSASQYVSAQISIAVILLAVTLLVCSSSSSLLELESLKYKMYHTIKTVETFWHKWTINLQDRSFIDKLNQQWDSQWKADCCSELQFYLLWFKIIKKIRCIAQMQRISEKTAMQQISKQQQNMQCLLNQLCKLLRTDRKMWSSR